MKKTILMMLLLIGLFGCAFLQAQKANWQACQSDPGCSAQAEMWKGRGETAGKLVATGAATIVPGVAVAIEPAGQVFGYLAFGLAMLIGGHALTKKKIEPVPPAA